MSKKLIFLLIALFGLAMTVESCGSSKNARKCDGRRATRTPMGNM